MKSPAEQSRAEYTTSSMIGYIIIKCWENNRLREDYTETEDFKWWGCPYNPLYTNANTWETPPVQ